MSLRAGFLQAQNRLEGIIIALISFIFALITLLILIILVNFFTDASLNLDDLIDSGFIGVFFDDDGQINKTKILNVVYWTTPLILTGLAVAIAFRAGLFNIGGQGQMIMGGTLAGIWAAALAPKYFDNPVIMIPTTILIGLIGGALWGFVPGVLKAYTGAHEVITTIMMNLIAISISFYLVNGPFRQRSSIAYGQTEVIKDSAKIPLIFPDINSKFNWSILLVIATVFIAHFILYKTNLGYKIRAVGLSGSASQSAGIDSKKTTVIAMALAGAMAGLAGTFIVMGVGPYRYRSRQETTYGFDGIAVALIGQNNPFPLIFGALIFAFLRQSGQNLELTRTPPEVILILQAIIILFTAIPLVARKLFESFTMSKTTKTTFSISNWYTQNRGSIYASLILLFTPILLIISSLTLNVDLFDIVNVFKSITPTITELMPVMGIFILIIPLTYGGKKISTSIFNKETERPYRKLMFGIITFFGIMESFLLLLYILNTLSLGFSDPVNFHFEIWVDFLSTTTLARALVLGLPLVLTAMGAAFNERAGVINIGFEGIMLFSAWGAVYFTYVSNDPYIGIIGGVLFGTFTTLIHAIWSITFKGEQIVAGVGINLLAIGVTDLFTKIVWKQEGNSADVNSLPKIILKDIPVIGDILYDLQLKNFYDTIVIGDYHLLRLIPDPIGIIAGQSVLLLIGIILIPICHFLLFHTTFGLRIRVIGEDPQTAATAGIAVRRYQYIAVLFSGFLSSLGGVFLSIGDSTFFRSGMTGGKGFIALAAMIFGKWTVIGSALAGFFFGYFERLSVKLVRDATGIPQEFFNTLPFIITLIVLSGAIG
ncbi:MAG: ABC transporter permease subunit, partial [Candidatus Hodarchaeales archaeon]